MKKKYKQKEFTTISNLLDYHIYFNKVTEAEVLFLLVINCAVPVRMMLTLFESS